MMELSALAHQRVAREFLSQYRDDRFRRICRRHVEAAAAWLG